LKAKLPGNNLNKAGIVRMT